VQLLKEAIPDLVRVAVFWNPTGPVHSHMVREAETAARTLGVQVRLVEARTPGAVLNLGGAMLFAHRARIAEHLLKSGLPAMCTAQEADLWRRAAWYVDRILNGARLAVNMRTARALGLSLPPSIMIQADHVIE